MNYVVRHSNQGVSHFELRKYWETFKNNVEKRQNLPRGLGIDPFWGSEMDEEVNEIRSKHLFRLLKVIYSHIDGSGELFRTSSSLNGTHNLDFFNKWVFNGIISKFPYRSQKNELVYQLIQTEDDGFNEWLNQVWEWEHKKIRVSKRNLQSINISHVSNWEENYDLCNNVYEKRINFLSEIVFTIHDFVSNESFYEGKSIYGTNMNSIREFLGQWVVRCYPLKDVVFHSERYSPKEKSIYEHWTPISFFRDLVMFTQTRKNKPSLMDNCVGDTNPIILTMNDWKNIIHYNYRVVFISKTEDDLLNSERWKSIRPIDSYEMKNIQIREKDVWSKLYS